MGLQNKKCVMVIDEHLPLGSMPLLREKKAGTWQLLDSRYAPAFSWV